VTFVIDSNRTIRTSASPTASSARSSRKPGDPEAYTLTVDQVLAKVEAAAVQGRDDGIAPGRPQFRRSPSTTTSRSSGRRAGASRRSRPTSSRRRRSARWPRSRALVRESSPGSDTPAVDPTRRRAPRFSRRECERRIEPKKGGPETWLDVHREAHRQGFKSTGTMMYGHVEGPEDVLDHLDAIRTLPGRHRRLHCLRPWSFKLAARYREVDQAVQGADHVPPRARDGAALPRQLSACAGLLVLRGQADRQVALPSGRRLGGDPLRGEMSTAPPTT